MAHTTALVACADRQEPGPAASPTESAPAPKLRLRGAGASFPAAIYGRWGSLYGTRTNVRVEYRQLGSQAGIEALRLGRTDFGATDIPLEPAALEAAGLVQVPVVVGGVVPVVNLPGIGPGDLVLDTALLSDIYRGEVTRWNDQAITAMNPDLKLPDQRILAIHRDDPSGTTWVFTRNLAAGSAAWERALGHGPTITWPDGIGARDNQQVVDFVVQFEQTIAYVELTHALRNDLAWVSLRLPDGRTIQPGLESFARAAEGQFADPADDLRLPTDTASAHGGWPLTSASYAVVRANQADPTRARALLDFLDWTWTEGRELARELGYVPLPSELVGPVRAQLAREVLVGGEPVWSPGPGPADEPSSPEPPALTEPPPVAGAEPPSATDAQQVEP
jgi:phosphate transport system substrate-binding protein